MAVGSTHEMIWCHQPCSGSDLDHLCSDVDLLWVMYVPEVAQKLPCSRIRVWSQAGLSLLQLCVVLSLDKPRLTCAHLLKLPALTALCSCNNSPNKKDHST
eukprot:4367572-Amphidinium_carterae.2